MTISYLDPRQLAALKAFRRTPANPKRVAETDLESDAGRLTKPVRVKQLKLFRIQIPLSALPALIRRWVKEYAVEGLVMAVLGIWCLVLWLVNPAAHRLFPIYTASADGRTLVNPELAYPNWPFTVPIWAISTLPYIIPLLEFGLLQYRIRSFHDFQNAAIGLFYSMLLGAAIQVGLKTLVGGLRPYFLVACKPDLSRMPTSKRFGFDHMLFDRSVCTGEAKAVKFAMTSFPSGHATCAFAAGFYVFLYLNAKFKVWSNYHAAFWKQVATILPLYIAVLVACSVVVEYNHNWYDALAGALIGIFTAILSYRAVWASVWDFRFNHIRLSRHVPFDYGTNQLAYATLGQATWTRRAGWGRIGGDLGGAPNNALIGSVQEKSASTDAKSGQAAASSIQSVHDVPSATQRASQGDALNTTESPRGEDAAGTHSSVNEAPPRLPEIIPEHQEGRGL